MLELGQHFNHAPCDAVAAFNRLIGIGVGPQRNGGRYVALRRQFRAQQFRRVGLDEELALEIQPRRQAHVGVGRPGIAIDAAVFTAAIGIDGPVEGNIRRLIARDDRLGRLGENLGAQFRNVGQRVPTVIDVGFGVILEAPGGIDAGAAATFQLRQAGQLSRAQGINGEARGGAHVHQRWHVGIRSLPP